MTSHAGLDAREALAERLVDGTGSSGYGQPGLP